MFRDLKQVFTGLDPLIRVVVLTGAGERVFCAGVDLHEFANLGTPGGREQLRILREGYEAIQDSPVPVIGAAMGAGLALLACCDFVIAAKGIALSLPELDAGVVGGGRHAARLVPESVMRRMFLTGEHIEAEEVLHHGGITEIVELTRLRVRTLEVARSIATKSPAAVRAAKASLDEPEFMNIKAGYSREQEYVLELTQHEESRIALSGILSHRPAIY